MWMALDDTRRGVRWNSGLEVRSCDRQMCAMNVNIRSLEVVRFLQAGDRTVLHWTSQRSRFVFSHFLWDNSR